MADLTPLRFRPWKNEWGLVPTNADCPTQFLTLLIFHVDTAVTVARIAPLFVLLGRDWREEPTAALALKISRNQHFQL